MLQLQQPLGRMEAAISGIPWTLFSDSSVAESPVIASIGSNSTLCSAKARFAGMDLTPPFVGLRDRNKRVGGVLKTQARVITDTPLMAGSYSSKPLASGQARPGRRPGSSFRGHLICMVLNNGIGAASARPRGAPRSATAKATAQAMRLMTPGPERIVVREQPRGESGLVGRQRPAMSAIRIGDAGHDTTGDHAESLGADGVLGETSSAGFPLPGRRH